ncbi:MAG: hypothetical protein GTN71_07695 [Anaerolineae bacterium]|nr:hypothetical protein [Anaerolineae bacterium]
MSWEEQREKEEKEEKGREEGVEEKWARDPLGTAIGALILIWLGVTLFLANLGTFAWIQWENFWAWFILGIGGLFILEVLIRLAVPEYRRPIGGRLIAGVILLAIGASFTFLPFDVSKLWPLIPIAIGLAILLGGLFRSRRP